MIPIVPVTAAPVARQPGGPGSLSLRTLPPLALYVHFPWCVRKCPYCDFNSHESQHGAAAIPEQEYLHALRADLESALPLIWGRPIISVFIGGGTPSLLSAAGVDTLLSDLRALLPLGAGCEVTLEANPGTVEAGRFAAYRASGVNRLSLGVQSFDGQQLRVLGRIHDRQQALAAIEIGAADLRQLQHRPDVRTSRPVARAVACGCRSGPCASAAAPVDLSADD